MAKNLFLQTPTAGDITDIYDQAAAELTRSLPNYPGASNTPAPGPAATPAPVAAPVATGRGRAPSREDLIQRAKELDVDPELALSFFTQESSGNWNSKDSDKNAIGGMQVVPETYKRMMGSYAGQRDPWKNMEAGLRYIAYGQKTLNTRDPELLAAGYHAGYDRDDLKAGKIPNTSDGHISTKDYARQVATRVGVANGRFKPLTAEEAAKLEGGNGASADETAGGRYRALTDEEAARLEAEPNQPLNRSLAPVTPEFRAEVDRAYDAATPEQRQAMMGADGVVGQLARERDARFKMAPTTETAGKFDTRAEARAARLARDGAAPQVADAWGREGARRGEIPGTELGTIGKSDFDFDAQQRFNKDPFFSNAVIRAAVKGYEGYKQGSLGLVQAGAELVGANGAAETAARGIAASQRTTTAIGEKGDNLQRNFEGAVSSIAQQLPAMLAGAATGTEVLPLAAMFTQTFGQEYGQGRAQGLQAGQAATRAGIFGAFEVIGEKFGLGNTLQAMKLAAKGANAGDVATVLAKGMLKEIPGEQLTTLGQFLTDKVPGIGTNLEAGLAEYLRQAGDTLAQTVIQGGLMMGGTTGVAAGVRHLKGAPSQASQEVEAEAARDAALNKAAAFGGRGAAPSDTAPSAPAPTGPVGRALSKAAPAAPAEPADLPRVSVTGPNGQTFIGFAEAINPDGSSRVIGDDGQVYEFTAADGVTVAPVADTAPEIAPVVAEAPAELGTPAPAPAPAPAPTPAPAADGTGKAASDAGDDAMYSQAVDVVQKNGRASISLVQRHLRIGYNRAARLLERMEADGHVSPMSSDGSRTVIAKPDAPTEVKPEPLPKADLASMSTDELRERMRYITQQSKLNGGSNKLFAEEKRRVAAEIDRRNAAGDHTPAKPAAAPVEEAPAERTASGAYVKQSDANDAVRAAARDTGKPHQAIEREEDGRTVFDVKPLEEADGSQDRGAAPAGTQVPGADERRAPDAADRAERPAGAAEAAHADGQRGADAGSTAEAPPALSKDLAGAKPRYNFGRKSFEPKFTNDIDLAAFIAAQDNPSKRDADYVRFVRDVTGWTESQVREHGKDVRAVMKQRASGLESGEPMNIPDLATAKQKSLARRQKNAVKADATDAKMAETGAALAEANGMTPVKGPMGNIEANTWERGTGAERISLKVYTPRDSFKIQYAVQRTIDGQYVSRTFESPEQADQAIKAKTLAEFEAVGTDDIPELQRPAAEKPAAEDAHAGKWFGTKEKAEAYISKKGAADTHEAVQTGKARFEVKPKAVAQIDNAAHEAATSPHNDLAEPTQAQKEAGNYKKGHINVQGLDITIENPRGSVRSGTSEDGTTWEHTMSDHYGYVKGTLGADGDHVDVYVGPNPESDLVVVVDQIDQRTGDFDEHKAMLGFNSRDEALTAYSANFDKGWKVGPVAEMTMAEFKDWLKNGDTTVPAAEEEGYDRHDATAARAAAVDYVRARRADGARSVHQIMPGLRDGRTFQTKQGAGDKIKAGHLSVDGLHQFKLTDLWKEADPAATKAEKPAVGESHESATAPEHVIGVDDRELGQIVDEFKDAHERTQEAGINRAFDPPAKKDVVRLNDKVKVYHKDHGWMTPAEAKEVIAGWKKRAVAQGADAAMRQANADKVVLSLFDLSGEWSKPWREAGYDVYQFDIQDDPEVGDVNNFSTEFFNDWFSSFDGRDVYAVLAACPCTDFASSGARHFAAKDADGRTVASVKLVHQTLNVIEYFNPAVWAIENPVGRIEDLGSLPPWRLSFDPNHLGDPYTKKTLIWGRFNGDLPVAPVEPTEGSKMHRLYGGKSQATKNARSVTPEGFAYGFFMANNAADHPVLAVAGKYDRLDRDLIQRALDAGVTPKQIDSAVEDFYYQDLDDDAANEAIRDLIPEDGPKGGKPADEPAKPAPAPSANKVFTDDAAEKARALLRKKLHATLNSGIDPEVMQAGITLAGWHIEKGARTFAAYAAAMLGDLGESVKPYLKSWYMGVKFDPRATGFSGMSSTADVESANIDEIATPSNAIAEESKGSDEGEGNARTTVRGAGAGPLEEVAAEGVPADAEGRDAERAGADGQQGSGKAGGEPDGSGVSAARGRGSRSARADSAAPRKGRVKKAPAAAPADLFAQDEAETPSQAIEHASPANVPALDFVITEDVRLGQGSEGVKFADNLAAIRILKALEAENRRASPDEQRALARYVGWGGLKNAFRVAGAKAGEGIAKGWEARVAELEELLTPAELKAARNSTTAAHYTSQPVVNAIWSAAKRLGFAGGSVLEPSVGTGNFLGLMPGDLRGKSNVFAVEYDSLTARIAQKLYPNADILHTGLQNVPLPRNQFALAIGNPPFGKESLNFRFNPSVNGKSIHNQFFLASLDSVADDGLMAMVVSHNLMDALNPAARQDMAERAHFIGAIRLPDTAFKENARTEVVTDVLFLRKRSKVDAELARAALDEARSGKGKMDWDSPEQKRVFEAIRDNIESWTQSSTIMDPAGSGEGINANGYFLRNPHMVVGKIDASGKMNGRTDLNVRLEDSSQFEPLLAAAVARLPQSEPRHDVAESSLKHFKLMTTAMRLAVQRAEPGQVTRGDDGKLKLVVDIDAGERGKSVLHEIELTADTPINEEYTLTLDGKWQRTVDKLGADGKPMKVPHKVTGAPTNRNLKETIVYDKPADIPAKDRWGAERVALVADMLPLRDLLKRQLVLEAQDATEKQMAANRAKLNAAYDAFVAKHGPLHTKSTAKLALMMPDGALALATEDTGKDGKPRKSAIMSRRVTMPPKPVERVKDAREAVAVTLAEGGRIDLERVASLLGADVAGAEKALSEGEKPAAFFDPEENRWEPADLYLSGLVRRKLLAAEAQGLAKNADALREVIPKDWDSSQIVPNVGSAWIPPAIYGDFYKHLGYKGARVSYSPVTNSFSVTWDGQPAAQWATTGRAFSPGEIMSRLLNSQSMKVTWTDSEGKTHIDEEATTETQQKANEIFNEFLDWAYQDDTRRGELVRIFNEKFNTRVVRQRDGSHLTLPGKVPDTIIKMRRHQNNAIWRGITDRAVLYDHVVGAGKTFTAIARAMERRRMGLSRKPMVVVPNHLVEQWAADAKKLYPGANILAAGKADFERANRRRLFARIGAGDFDMVIIGHSSFGFIDLDQATEERYLTEELEAAYAAIKEAEEEAEAQGQSGWKKPFGVKEAERLVKKLEERLARIRDTTRDRLLTFEEMGIDDLTIDEAHEFKNLAYSSRLTGVSGMGNKTGSQKAMDLHMKVRSLNDRPGTSVAFLTGTPISNSVAEMYLVLRNLVPKEMKEMGIDNFDAWRSMYVSYASAYEPTEAGGIKEVTRLGREWMNMKSLMDLYYSVSDAVTIEDIKQAYAEDNPGKKFPVPDVRSAINGDGDREMVAVKPTLEQREILKDIVAGFNGLDSIKDAQERNAARLRLMDRARKVSLDPRAVDPTMAVAGTGGKLGAVVDRVARIYEKWDADKGTQLIFLDRSVPKAKGDDKIVADYDEARAALQKAITEGDEKAEQKALDKLETFNPNEVESLRAALAGGWNAYDEIKRQLVARGIPEAEIRFVQEANTDKQKADLFALVKAGKVRVLIGSTPRMGAGTNVQDRLVALHHVDVTWKPSDIEQREGRIVRQGNLFVEETLPDASPNPNYKPGFAVDVVAYATEMTVDAKMWALNATKLKAINGIRKYDGSFQMEFEDAESASMAEMAALATGNPLMVERVTLNGDITKLEMQQRSFKNRTNAMRDRLNRAKKDVETAPAKIERNDAFAAQIEAAKPGIEERSAQRHITINGKRYDSEAEGRGAAEAAIKEIKGDNEKARWSLEVNGEKVTNLDNLDSAFIGSFGQAGYEATVDGGKPLITLSATSHRIMAKAAEKSGREFTLDGITVNGIPVEMDVEESKWSEGERYLTLNALNDKGQSMADSSVPLGKGELAAGNIRAALDRLVSRFLSHPDYYRAQARMAQSDAKAGAKEMPELEAEVAKPWPKEQELKDKRDRLKTVIAQLAATSDAARLDSVETEDDRTTPHYAVPEGAMYSIAPSIASELRGLAELAGVRGNDNRTVSIAAVPAGRAEQLAAAGIEVKGYTHTADMFAVRHALNRHGVAEEKAEKARGQLPLTADDIASIADIIATPDSMVLGMETPRHQPIIGYVKRLADGTVLYLEEVRTGRKTLAMTSMRKYPGTTDLNTIVRGIVPSYAQSDTGDVQIITPESSGGQASTDSGNRNAIALDANTQLGVSLLRDTLLSSEVGGLFRALLNAGRVVLHETAATVPTETTRGVQAVTLPDGTIHMIARNLDQLRAVPVLLHEMFHSGVRPLLGEESWKKLMVRLHALMRQGQQSTGRARQFYDAAFDRQRAAARVGDTRAMSPEEFGAYTIEEYEKAPAAYRSWVDDTVGAIKAWVLRHFGIQAGAVTPAQLRALALAALKRGGKPGGGTPKGEARQSVAPEQADAALDAATEELDKAPVAADDHIGRLVGDISLGARLIVHPRTIAAVHPEFTPVYNTAISQMETRDRNIAELGRNVAAYDALPQAGKEAVNKVLELGRLSSKTYTEQDVTGGITNTGTKTVIEIGEDGKPKPKHIPFKALLTEKGEVITLSADEAKAYLDLRGMFDAALDKFRDQTLVEFGFPDLAGQSHDVRPLYIEDNGDGTITLKGSISQTTAQERDGRTEDVTVSSVIRRFEGAKWDDKRHGYVFDGRQRAKLEKLLDDALSKGIAFQIEDLIDDATPPARAEGLRNIANFIREIEQAKRTGYVPFARYGDYVVTVKEKIADLQYVEDDAEHYLVKDVPSALEQDLTALGAEPITKGKDKGAWRIKKSQRQAVERLTEKTVYSAKIETGLTDMLKGRKAEQVDELPTVKAAIEAARKEWVGNNPSRRVVAFRVNDKQPDGAVRLSDVDALAEIANIDNVTWDAVRDKLATAIKGRSFRKHFFHSDNVPGYTGDFERAIADYVIGMSGYLARRAHQKRWDRTVDAIKAKGKLHQYASRYRDYVNSPQEEFAMVRQIGFFAYIAGVMATAFANLTQVPFLTVPTLAQVAPMPLVLKETTRAYKDAMLMLTRKEGLDMFDPKKAPADVRAALMQAWDEGAFVPLETFDLMMTARQRNVGQRKVVKGFNTATKVVSIAFTFAERLNRLVTFIAAARLAEKQAIQKNAAQRLSGDALARAAILGRNWNAKNFAEWVVDESQFRMGKANRPTTMRGVGAALMQFKGFMIQTFEAWYRMAALHGKSGKFAAAASLLVLYSLAGMWGLPGADDLRKLIEAAYKTISDKDLDLKTELRAWVARISGSNTIGQIVTKGASYPLGVDLTRVGLGSVAPDSPLAALGIPFDLAVGRPKRAVEKASADDYFGAAAEFMPNFAKHWLVSAGWAVDGVRDKRGQRILNPEQLSAGDLALKAVGFQPSIVTDIRDYEYAQRRQETAVDGLKRKFTADIARTLVGMEKAEEKGDPAKLAELEKHLEKVYAEMAEHNETAKPEAQIQIGSRAIRQRMVREREGVMSTWGKERKGARGGAEELRGVFGLGAAEQGEDEGNQ